MSIPSFSTIRNLSLRVQLTLVLVAVVLALGLAAGVIAYRSSYRTLEEDAVASVESLAAARRDAVRAQLSQEHDHLLATIELIQVGCAASSGVVERTCARETLREFLGNEGVLGARVRYGRGATVVVGRFNREHEASSGVAEFYLSKVAAPVVRISATKPQYGISVDADYRSSWLLRDTDLRARTELVVGNSDTATLVGGSATQRTDETLRACLAGNDGWGIVVRAANAPRLYRAYRHLPDAPGICAIAETPQRDVAVRAGRIRARLLRLAGMFAVAAIPVAALVSFVFTLPLRRLETRVRKLREGDYEAAVPVVGTGEIRSFAQALAETTQAVRNSRTALIEAQKLVTLAYRAAQLWVWEQELSTDIIKVHDPSKPGAPSRNTTSQALLRLLHPDDRGAVIAAMQRAKAEGSYEAEYRVHRPDGQYRWMASWGAAVGEGAGARIVGVTMDLSARKEAEALAREKERLAATAEMASSLAHEINNPLTAVVSALYMAESCATTDAELARFLKIARQESERIATISRQILALHPQRTPYQNVSLETALNDAVTLCQPYFRTKQQTLTVQLRTRTAVFGLPHEIRTALVTFLRAASEATPEAGTIICRARSAAGLRTREAGTYITIADHGKPVTEPERRMLNQGRLTASVSGRDTGLSIWIARNVILKYGGYVRVRPFAGRCEGNLVRIYLPQRSGFAK